MEQVSKSHLVQLLIRFLTGSNPLKCKWRCDNPLHSQKKECLAFRKHFKAMGFYKITKPATTATALSSITPSWGHAQLQEQQQIPHPSLLLLKKASFRHPTFFILTAFPLANVPRKLLKAKAIEKMSYLSPSCWFPTTFSRHGACWGWQGAVALAGQGNVELGNPISWGHWYPQGILLAVPACFVGTRHIRPRKETR